MDKRNRVISMIDFSKGTENLIDFAFLLAQFTNAKIIFIHQIAINAPVLADDSSRNQIERIEIEETVEKLKKLTANRIYPSDSFIVSSKSIPTILNEIKSEKYNDWVVGGLKKNNLIKQFLLGSTLVKILEYSDLITITVPLTKPILIPEKLFIAVTHKYPLNELQLNVVLSGLKSSLKEISFFTILDEDQENIDTKNYLEGLQKRFNEYNSRTVILNNNYFFNEAKRLVSNNENSFLVVQEGSRTLADEIFRKFHTSEIIHSGNIPLIILSK
jgi:nucleotide-binding universal stress UspA family protein